MFIEPMITRIHSEFSGYIIICKHTMKGAECTDGEA